MPNLIIINGSVGSGKTTVAKLLSKKLTDLNYNLKIDDLIWNFSNHETNTFNKNNAVFAIAHSITESCLSINLSVIVEKVMSIDQFNEFIQIGDLFSIKPLHIILTLPLEKTIKRVEIRRKMDGRICDEEYINRVKQSHDCTNELIGIYKNQVVIAAHEYTPEQICEKILDEIRT